MTGKWKAKPKRVVETSLGKAPKETEKGPDVSHLRKPITTSIYGVKQVLSLFQTATAEVQDYITNECDILYECKVCRTIFRSLANFILHKRNYCREKYQFGGGGTEGGFVINDDLKTSDEESRAATPIEKSDSEPVKPEKKTILPIIDKLVKKQKIQILAKETLNEDLSNKGDNSDDDVIFVSEETNVVLQKIDTSRAAVFQTSVKDCEKLEESNDGLMRSEVLEIHGILDNNQAVLGSNGKVCAFKTNKLSKPNIPKQNLVCTECNFTFSTEKTLTHHIKYKHNKTCMVFPCPDCKETFSNAWSVYRHLYKVHRRTNSQVRRMRYLVHSSGIRKDQEPEKKKRKINVEENEENQWMNNFEGDKDFQMCSGCGKRFERKAALHSHSQMCTKRIALCNSIKNGKVVKSEKKLEKIEPTNGIGLKGAAKRKQKAPVAVSDGKKREDSVKEEKVCDVKSVDEKIKVEDVKTAVIVSEVKVDDVEESTTDEQSPAQPLEDPLAVSITKSENITITKHESDVDITITKHNDSEPETPNPAPIHLADLPEIEIYTISDDSTDNETPDKNKTLKRKRNNFNSENGDISDEYKEYVNDEGDHCFLAKTMTFIDRNDLKCTPCGSSFLSIYMLLRHMSLHFSWFRFQCSKCNFVSFHKYDCTAHAYSRHSTPNNLIESTVLPIPNWKVLCTSHDFKKITEEETDNQADVSNKTMPQLEAIEEKSEENGLEENGLQATETIILEDDEMPDITDNAFSDTVVLSDDETKEGIVGLEKKKATKAGPSKTVSDRPIRNRTKSVKTVQNDFIYDLGKALKLNDNSVKNKKVKKSLGKV